MKHKAPGLRPLISLTLLLSFFFSLLSGIALYLRPEGALARWLCWSWLGFDKKSWEMIHIGSVLLLLISGIWHSLLNWKALWGYLRSRTPALKIHWREGLMAMGLTLLFSFGALWQLPPFSNLSNLRGAIKDGKTQHLPLPPSNSAEKLNLEELAKLMSLSPNSVQKRLLNRGLTLPPGRPSLSTIASANHISPAQVFQILIHD